MAFSFSDRYLGKFISSFDYAAVIDEAKYAFDLVKNKNGQGSDFLGWVNLPYDHDMEEYERIKKAAKKIQDTCDVFLVIGIGGSYLGARAAVEFVKGNLYNEKKKDTPNIYFIGNDISSSHMRDVIELCEGKDVCINVISKSGTTTEPGIAFRVLRSMLEKKYGAAANERIFVTTDAKKGALRPQAEEYKYESFVVPDDIGGRYSVLSAVGLLPIAVAGIDLDEMFEGAKAAADKYSKNFNETNECVKYACIRNLLLRKGKNIELLASNDPSMTMFCEWWKQLYGESEGKDGKGLYPASVIYSTDLHSLGQYIQEGQRTLFETVINVNIEDNFVIEADKTNADGLNFVAGKTINYVNQQAVLGTALAHVDGNVPNIAIEITSRNAYDFGYLVYFFEFACAVSGYMLGINPFNQPGVEAYKKNMFALLGKPGYEEATKSINERLEKLSK
ncbi:MAG: glucose-6-phosphate isomerase [Clostridiales bacterium]|nr:glucose-6-phosphate isomerase [Clostridiales bacterium]